MLTGRITELHPGLEGGGWGFVQPDQAGTGFDRVYFNSNGLQRTTKEFRALGLGDRVEMTVIAHPKGARGIEIRVIR